MRSDKLIILMVTLVIIGIWVMIVKESAIAKIDSEQVKW